MGKIRARVWPTPANCAYMAGILDGEGSISLVRAPGKHASDKPWWKIVVTVSSCDEVLIDWISDRWGGTVLKDMDRGETRRLQHRWLDAHARTRAVLEACLPYLVIKRERALKALEVLDIQSTRDGTGRSYSEDQRQRLEELRVWFDEEKRTRSAAARGVKVVNG